MAKSSDDTHSCDSPACLVRLDRLVIVSPRFKPKWSDDRKIEVHPPISGFRGTGNWFPKQQGKIRTYRRVRSFLNSKTGTKLFVQSERAHGFLKPVRVTIVGNDATGILWPDLKKIGDAYRDILVRMLELSFDFAPSSGVDKEYVLKHALFGKSRPVKDPRYPDLLRYGTRDSDKMARCYWKPQVNAFRVELEFHSGKDLPETDCFLYTMRVWENDFRFVYVRWRALDSHLAGKGVRGKRIAREARLHYNSIHELLGYLRSVGVNNPHRFLETSKRDAEIRKAFEKWRFSLTGRERNRRHPETQIQIED
jgi:hypothetical protein